MESNSDSQILKKQNLLKNEIIDKNYDKELFLDFCISKKDNGDDLDNWTLNELIDIINEFKTNMGSNENEKDKFQEKKDKKKGKKNKKEDKDEEVKVEVEKIKIYVKEFLEINIFIILFV